jgi:hypothetical protein
MTHRSRRIAICSVLAIGLAAASARAACPGDCDGSGRVDVTKLIRGVNIALGHAPLTSCTAFDVNGDGQVSVNELIAAVNATLHGCPVETASPTASPTPTMAIEPIFPANYRDTFTVVRDCRLGIEHGGVMIRVFANSVAAQPYLHNQNPLPLGSIVVKEEFDGTDCSNDADLTRWSAMRKESPGFDPVDNDWHWQRVTAPSRQVTCDDKTCPGFVCITCHRAAECVARDYMCTVNDAPPRGTLTPVLENLPAAVLSISGTGPTDVYAVGSDPHDGRGPYVIHYDGTGWTRLDSGASGDLWWISVTPIDGSFYLAGSDGLILQYDLAAHRFTPATTPNTTAQLFGIWGTAANNLWAVGGDDEQQGVLWHYDGGNWTVQDVSQILPSGIPTTLYKIWGTGPTDVYAVGETGVMIHYDGVSWSALPRVVSNTLFTVHGGGSVLAAVGGFFSNGLILERKNDGTFQQRTPSGAPQLNGIFVPGNGNAIAVGNGLSVAARDASGWTLVNEGTDPQVRDFHGVWIDGDDGIWAVGGDLSGLGNGVLAYGGPQVVAGGPVR